MSSLLHQWASDLVQLESACRESGEIDCAYRTRTGLTLSMRVTHEPGGRWHVEFALPVPAELGPLAAEVIRGLRTKFCDRRGVDLRNARGPFFWCQCKNQLTAYRAMIDLLVQAAPAVDAMAAGLSEAQ